MVAGNQAVQRKSFNPRHQPHVERPTSSTTIAVGCKLPNGMHLDIRKLGEPTKRVTLKGINSLSQGLIIRPAVRGGFAITEGVPKEFFERWMELNANHPAVKNELIFAHEQAASVRAMGEERDQLQHGFEPVDPNKPGTGIETRKDND